MPQKKNVDIAELLRSKVHVVLGNYVQLVGLSSNLISGYNRDLQDSKKPLFESLELTLESLKVATLLVKGIKVNHQAVQQSLTPEIFATHFALNLVKQGIPFRAAYQQTSQHISEVSYDPAEAIQTSKHLGGVGNLGLKFLTKQTKVQLALFKTEKTKYLTSQTQLLEGVEKDEN